MEFGRSSFLVALVALAALCFVAGTHAAEIEDCDDKHDLGKYLSVTISGCKEDDEKCPLIRGKNSSIGIEFETKVEIAKVKQIVHGEVLGTFVPFPLNSDDACTGTKLTCPLKVGTHSYLYDIYVKESYPKRMSVIVKWELKDEKDNNIVCVLIPAILK